MLNRPAAVIALEQIEDAPDAQSATVDVTDGGTATVHWSESLGKVVLVIGRACPIAADESFEMWFVRDDGLPFRPAPSTQRRRPTTVCWTERWSPATRSPSPSSSGRLADRRAHHRSDRRDPHGLSAAAHSQRAGSLDG